QAKKRVLEPFGLVEEPVKTAAKGERIDDHYPKKKKARIEE
nr:Chain B, VP1 [Adeno-associated virus - Po1]